MAECGQSNSGESHEDPERERREVRLRSVIDLARAEPVAVAKHGRPVVVVMAVEEYERLKFFETGHVDSRPSTTGKAD